MCFNILLENLYKIYKDGVLLQSESFLHFKATVKFGITISVHTNILREWVDGRKLKVTYPSLSVTTFSRNF